MSRSLQTVRDIIECYLILCATHESTEFLCFFGFYVKIALNLVSKIDLIFFIIQSIQRDTVLHYFIFHQLHRRIIWFNHCRFQFIDDTVSLCIWELLSILSLQYIRLQFILSHQTQMAQIIAFSYIIPFNFIFTDIVFNSLTQFSRCAFIAELAQFHLSKK